MSAWGWPQWAYAGLMAFGVVVSISKHGQPQGVYSGPMTFITVALCVWILWMGGFWS